MNEETGIMARRNVVLNNCLDKIDIILKAHYGEGFRYQIEDEGDGYSILLNIYEDETAFELAEKNIHTKRELSEE
jgi:hypothetical protein